MSVTSANAILTLSVPGVFQVPTRIQGFATDDIFGSETLKRVTTMMGVDGILTGGFNFVEFKQTIHLMADSRSGDFFDQWDAFMGTLIDAYPAFGAITLPSLNRSFVLTKGFLTGYKPLPDGKKQLQQRDFEVTWEKIIGNPIQALVPTPLPNPG